MEANVLLTKCTRSHKAFGVRVEKMEDGDWWRTWAFEIRESTAKSEGFDKTPVRGNLYGTDEYPGCPYCGTFGFVQCNKCKKLTCWNDEKKLTCLWCNNPMNNITLSTDKFDVSGNQL